MTTVSKVCAKSAAALLKLKAGMRIYILKKTSDQKPAWSVFLQGFAQVRMEEKKQVLNPRSILLTGFSSGGEMTQLCTSCARQPAGEINRVNVSDDFEIMAQLGIFTTCLSVKDCNGQLLLGFWSICLGHRETLAKILLLVIIFQEVWDGSSAKLTSCT